jgi:hypothetical protein
MRNASVSRILTILIVALGLYAVTAGAEPNNKQSKKPDGAAVAKSSKSTSSLMDKIKEVGNDASKGIHRATQGVRNIGDKAGKTTKEPTKEK